MKTLPNGAAPTGNSYKIGAKGGKVAQAWQIIWNQLDHETFQDARVLADAAGKKLGIQTVSIMSHLHRMAAEGHLDSTAKAVDVQVHKAGREFPSRRKRLHIRLPQEKPQTEITAGG